MNPKISIVVLCRNESDYIDACINSLKSQDINAPYEILVIDGMSVDGTRKILAEKHPDIKVVDNLEKLTPQAWNLGFTNARGDYVAVVSGHGVYMPSWLSTLYTDAEKYNFPVVGGIHKTPETYNSFEIAQNAVLNTTLGGFGSSYSTKHIDKGDPIKEVNSVAFALYRRDVIEKVGLVNTDFVKGQDMEYNFRVKQAGFRIFQDRRAIVYYRKRKTLQDIYLQMKGYGHAKAQMIRTHKSYMKQGFRAMIPFGLLTYLIPGFIIALLIGVFLNFKLMPFLMLYFMPILAYIVFLELTIANIFAKYKHKDIAIFANILIPLIHLSYGYGVMIGLVRNFKDIPDPEGVQIEN